MPQAIHESTAFNSRNRKVAIHCVFSVKDNTHSPWGGPFCAHAGGTHYGQISFPSRTCTSKVLRMSALEVATDTV